MYAALGQSDSRAAFKHVLTAWSADAFATARDMDVLSAVLAKGHRDFVLWFIATAFVDLDVVCMAGADAIQPVAFRSMQFAVLDLLVDTYGLDISNALLYLEEACGNPDPAVMKYILDATGRSVHAELPVRQPSTRVCCTVCASFVCAARSMCADRLHIASPGVQVRLTACGQVFGCVRRGPSCAEHGAAPQDLVER